MLMMSAVIGSGFAEGDGKSVNIAVESQVTALADGFANAYNASNLQRRSPVILTMQRGERLFVLEDVRGIRQASGILAVEVGKGVIYLINPSDVLSITDGYPPKPVIEAIPAVQQKPAAVVAPVANPK